MSDTLILIMCVTVLMLPTVVLLACLVFSRRLSQAEEAEHQDPR